MAKRKRTNNYLIFVSDEEDNFKSFCYILAADQAGDI
jgi:hypothetical protein